MPILTGWSGPALRVQVPQTQRFCRKWLDSNRGARLGAKPRRLPRLRAVRHLPVRHHEPKHGHGMRAGVGQASKEETAECSAAVWEGYGPMGIRTLVTRWIRCRAWATTSKTLPKDSKSRPSFAPLDAVRIDEGRHRARRPDFLSSARSREGSNVGRAAAASWCADPRWWRTDRLPASQRQQDNHRSAAARADEGRLSMAGFGIEAGNLPDRISLSPQ
jgi:hypothetical protein